MSTVADFHRSQCEYVSLSRVLRGQRPPEGTQSRIPLKHAIEFLGRAIHGDTWSGHEQLRITAPALPDPIGSTLLASLFNEAQPEYDQGFVQWSRQPEQAAIDYACLLLSEFAPEMAPRRQFSMMASWPPDVLRFTRLQWRTAQALAKERDALIDAEWQRLFRTHKHFKTLCVEKRLNTYLRPGPGGDFEGPVEWWAWNGENILHRFATYRMSPSDPFNAVDANDGTHWIFVDVPELEAAIAQLMKRSAEPSGNTSVRYIGPYLKFAMDISTALGISAENMPKKHEIIAEVMARWNGQRPISARIAGAIATLVRNEESQSGRGSKHDHKRRMRPNATS